MENGYSNVERILYDSQCDSFLGLACAILAIISVGASAGGIVTSQKKIIGTAIGAIVIVGPIFIVLIAQYLRLQFRKITIYEDGIDIAFGIWSRQFKWSDLSALQMSRIRGADIGIILYDGTSQIVTINQNY